MAPWKQVQYYIAKHGGRTHAGTTALKERYRALMAGDVSPGQFRLPNRKGPKVKKGQKASGNSNGNGNGNG
jgi:hypothetical protein